MKRALLLNIGRGITRSTVFYAVVLVFSACAPGSAQTKQQSAKANQYPFKVEVIGHGQPMILIPGLSSSGQVWESTIARYKANYECHVLTLAGFAGEPPTTEPFLEKARLSLADYIRAKKLRKPVVVGHSLGGILTLWLASKEPALVGPIIIVDALPYAPASLQPNANPESLKSQAEAMRKALIAQSREQRQQMQLTTLQTMITDPSNVALAAKWGALSDPATIAQAMYEMLTIDLRPELVRIKAPTLVIGTWIGLRQYATREQVEKSFREQYATLSGHKFVMSEKARHFVMLDDPEFLFKEMDSFLISQHQKGRKR
ncbi:MAG: N-formylmaleamate deformylase [Acidobacteriota bacterium]|jgi:pimeloyl-ACP methyl ester carboxylesterase|nr:N-formylmaleamate deformylase [Acidobacteriota bacterium]